MGNALSTRTKALLKTLNIENKEDLNKYADGYRVEVALLRTPGIGKKTLKEVLVWAGLKEMVTPSQEKWHNKVRLEEKKIEYFERQLAKAKEKLSAVLASKGERT